MEQRRRRENLESSDDTTNRGIQEYHYPWVLGRAVIRPKSPDMSRKRSEIPARVGRQLRLLREERGLTQDTVGERAGYSGKYVSEIERGLRDPALTTLERLAERGVGSSLQDLLGGVTETAAAPPASSDSRRNRLRRSVQKLADHVLELPADVATRVVGIMQAVVDLARKH